MIIALALNWQIDPLMHFLDITATYTCLNKVESLEVRHSFPWKMLRPCWAKHICSKFLFWPVEIFFMIGRTVLFLIALQNYLKNLVLQLGVSNHMPQENSKCPLCHLTEHTDSFTKWLESWQRLSFSWRKEVLEGGAVRRCENKNLTRNEKRRPWERECDRCPAPISLVYDRPQVPGWLNLNDSPRDPQNVGTWSAILLSLCHMIYVFWVQMTCSSRSSSLKSDMKIATQLQSITLCIFWVVIYRNMMRIFHVSNYSRFVPFYRTITNQGSK